jgi:hypothetical protein
MPDKAKLRVLQEHGVRNIDSCARCSWGLFENERMWGQCVRNDHVYIHVKHGREHRATAHAAWICDDYEPSNPCKSAGPYGMLLPWISPRCCSGEEPLLDGHSLGCPSQDRQRIRMERRHAQERVQELLRGFGDLWEYGTIDEEQYRRLTGSETVVSSRLESQCHCEHCQVERQRSI